MWIPNEEQTVQNIQVLHVCPPTGTVKWSENLILSKNLTKTQHLIPKYNLQPYFKLFFRLSPFPCTLTECSAAWQISLCLTWNKNMLGSLLINPNRNTNVRKTRMVANYFLRLFSHFQNSDSKCCIKNCEPQWSNNFKTKTATVSHSFGFLRTRLLFFDQISLSNKHEQFSTARSMLSGNGPNSEWQGVMPSFHQGIKFISHFTLQVQFSLVFIS